MTGTLHCLPMIYDAMLGGPMEACGRPINKEYTSIVAYLAHKRMEDTYRACSYHRDRFRLNFPLHEGVCIHYGSNRFDQGTAYVRQCSIIRNEQSLPPCLTRNKKIPLEYSIVAVPQNPLLIVWINGIECHYPPHPRFVRF